MNHRSGTDAVNLTLADERRDVAARINLWLMDDHEEFRERFGLLLTRFFGFEHVHPFQSAEASIEALEVAASPDIVLLDVSNAVRCCLMEDPRRLQTQP